MTERIEFIKANKKCTENLKRYDHKKKVIVKGRQDGEYKKRKLENIVRKGD